MPRITAALLLIAASFVSSPAIADFTPSPTTLEAGNIAVLNTVTGNITMCWKFNSLPTKCQIIGQFATPSVTTRIISSAAQPVFYVSDTSSGRLMRCDHSNPVNGTSSGWTCVELAAALP